MCPSLDRHPLNRARFDQLVYGDLGRRDFEAVIVRDVRQNPDSERSNRVEDEGTPGDWFVHERVQKVVWNDVGDRSIDSLEIRATNRGDHTVLKKVFQSNLDIAPVPPTAATLVALAVKLTECGWTFRMEAGE
ncbi:unannotated protein [freshwater metagenome]|uniref:Unannotated protein n=1 Tax=freshwater metagenome TaxID=449393 RepID=A0A6J6BHK9_9ZZZZ